MAENSRVCEHGVDLVLFKWVLVMMLLLLFIIFVVVVFVLKRVIFWCF